MSKLFRSMRNAFRRRPDPEQLANESNGFDDQLERGSYKRSPYQGSRNQSDNNEDFEDSNYTDPSQTSYYKSKRRDTATEDEPQLPQSSPLNRPSSEGRYEAADVPTNSTRSNENRRNAKRLPNNVTSPIARPPVQQQNLPRSTQNQTPSAHPPPNPIIQQPPINGIPNAAAAQTQSNPSSNPIPESSLLDNFIAFLNQNQQQFPVNPNSNLVGFSSNQQQRNGIQNNIFDRFRRLRTPNRSSFTPQQSAFTPRVSSFTPKTSSFPLRNDTSNYEIDYPIENVLIDGNVSQSMAIKINEAVEHDRFGNAYRRERYAYEPAMQQINIDNYPRMQRRLVETPHRSGMRYVREITNNNIYPQNLYRPSNQTQNFNDIQLMADRIPELNFPMTYSQVDYQSFPTPIRHYTACALPNDPMRIY